MLDDDEEFRQRVRDATTEEGMGRASWLFLDRPKGWEEELASLISDAERAADAAEELKEEAGLRRRVERLESSLRRANEELARLHRELAGAKEQLAGERRGRRRAESDAGRLRRETLSLATEVDEIRHQHAHLQQALDQQEEHRPPAVLEPILELPAPAIDAAAVAALIAQGAEAAGAVSQALAEAGQLLAAAVKTERPEALRVDPVPGPGSQVDAGRRQPTPLPPGTFDDSVEAANHLVRVAGMRVLVDGYNVTKSARPELALAEQRQWLADAATELAARTGARVELVFDGADDRASAPADLGRRQGVQLRFSAEGIEADDVLLELVDELPAGVPVTVVSGDHRVRDGARSRGANVVGNAQFLAVLGRPLA